MMSKVILYANMKIQIAPEFFSICLEIRAHWGHSHIMSAHFSGFLTPSPMSENVSILQTPLLPPPTMYDFHDSTDTLKF